MYNSHVVHCTVQYSTVHYIDETSDNCALLFCLVAQKICLIRRQYVHASRQFFHASIQIPHTTGQLLHAKRQLPHATRQFPHANRQVFHVSLSAKTTNKYMKTLTNLIWNSKQWPNLNSSWPKLSLKVYLVPMWRIPLSIKSGSSLLMQTI